MKLAPSQLRKIIKEEVRKHLNEHGHNPWDEGYEEGGDPEVVKAFRILDRYLGPSEELDALWDLYLRLAR